MQALVRYWAVVVGILSFTIPFAGGQSQEMQEKIAAIKQASARNKQSLARYTWQERQTISVKGEVKKQVVYQVQMSADGKPQKTQLSESPQPSSSSDSSDSSSSMGRRRGRVKEKVVEKKKAEFKEYGQQVGTLAHSYAQHDPERLQAAVQAGNLTVTPAGPDGTMQMTMRNYVKPDDSVTILVNPATHSPQTIDVNSYLEDVSDKVTMSIRFGQLPDGTNYPARIQVKGESKKLDIVIENSHYFRN